MLLIVITLLQLKGTDGRREKQVPSSSRRTRLLARVFFCCSRFHSFSLMLEISTKLSTLLLISLAQSGQPITQDLLSSGGKVLTIWFCLSRRKGIKKKLIQMVVLHCSHHHLQAVNSLRSQQESC
ncbi:uncharacterized protein [Arachis hypogaea]|uniref:uncharacterized protein isoform X2 n=1 Tax=Arachis hypogaea TaxID=3818 RepID=UPI000DED2C84|nr:uncharacterized protein LOC112741764 isoform X2 [Arachis hypogaea]